MQHVETGALAGALAGGLENAHPTPTIIHVIRTVTPYHSCEANE